MRDVNRHANTSMVEEYLYSILNGVVSDHTFAGTLPSAIGNEWNDMVLIDCDLPMTDYGVYSSATVYIFLYARPKADGSKNVPVLNSMENALCDVLDSISDDHYSVDRLSNGADFDTTINWHRNFVYFNLIITC
jgi:hypothetical protein